MLLKELLNQCDNDQLRDIWHALGFEADDLPAYKTERVHKITIKAMNLKRLDMLFSTLFEMKLLPNARPFFPLLIVQSCQNARLNNPEENRYPLKNICTTIGDVQCEKLLLDESGYYSWSNEEIVLKAQARTLQTFMEENGRFPDLLNAVQQQSPRLDLTPFLAAPQKSEPSLIRSQRERVYHNFDLRIRGKNANGRYPIEVGDNPLGLSGHDEQNINPAAAYLTTLIERIKIHRTRKVKEEDVRELGKYLHKLLFPEHVKEVLFANRADMAEKGDGLRLRLQIEPPELQKLPWEYCYDDAFGYYALHLDTPMVRYEERPFKSHPLPVPSPLKLLVVVSEPHDLARLNVEKEVDIIRTLLKAMGKDVQWEILRNAEIGRVRRALDKRPHIFHFIGHGGQSGDQPGTLSFENASGNSHQVTGEQLMVMMAGRGIKTVILNACQTAASGTQDAFGSVATALVRAEIPAVIAMKFNIRDDVALGFTRDLYGGLISGRPLDTAVTDMRIGAFVLGESHWGIPTLYMRSPDGKIWQHNPQIEQKFRDAVVDL